MDENKKTLNVLRGLIIVFAIITIIIEFDFIEKILMFCLSDPKYCSVKMNILVHLKKHGDFYENIALGAVASAIISVATIRTVVNEQRKREDELCLSAARDTLVAYIKLMGGLKNINKLEKYNNLLIEKMNNFAYQCNKSEKLPTKYKELRELCDSIFIPMTFEIDYFVKAMNQSPWFNDEQFINMHEKELYDKALINICNELYILLDKEYSFVNIMNRLNKDYIMVEIINQNLVEMLQETMDALSQHKKITNQVVGILKYSSLINKCFEEVVHEFEKEGE